MNGYRRPGFSSGSSADSRVLHLVSNCPSIAASVLAAEERYEAAIRQNALAHELRESGLISSGPSNGSMWLRRSVGSALIRLGRRVEGTPRTVATMPTG
jgi:hypothetical protein